MENLFLSRSKGIGFEEDFPHTYIDIQNNVIFHLSIFESRL